MEIFFTGSNQREYRECDMLCLFVRPHGALIAVRAFAAQRVYEGVSEKQKAVPCLSVESDKQSAYLL